jgi:uncharacterized membrane protein YcaP (DUF421 family)
MEFIQIKSDRFEKAITGKAQIVIDNGTLHEKNLKKLRLTVDQLEMQLREKSVSKISDVKWATLEPNGQLGFELKPEAQPVTKKDFEEFKQTMIKLVPSTSQLAHINEIVSLLNKQLTNQSPDGKDLFEEVKNNVHIKEPPKHLQ